MPAIPEFLIIDDNIDNRFLLTKTLRRKYPGALLEERQDSKTALVAATLTISAAVVHRAADVQGLPMVGMLGAANPRLPILCVSGFDQRERALELGANAFLHDDAWLNVGASVACAHHRRSCP
ncbi:MAG TPA: response regulator [Vicinamibacterales bacterium]|nr:response regulator [Vicinamibacterales bacterium]